MSSQQISKKENMCACVYSPSPPFGKKSHSFYMQRVNANANSPPQPRFHGTCNRMRREAAQYLMHLFNPISLPDSCMRQVNLLLGENLDYT